jgi:hypothetical protein
MEGEEEGEAVGWVARYLDDMVPLTRFAGEEAQQAALGELCTQLEQLLWLAYKLQLAPLISTLHGFIFNSTITEDSFLRGNLQKVFTPRVLEAALGPRQSTAAREWINSIVAQPAAVYTLASGTDRPHEQWLLEPCGGGGALPDLPFIARLKRPFLGLPTGVEVEVTLSLDSGLLHVGDFNVPVQLLLGPAVCSDSDHVALMGRPE